MALKTVSLVILAGLLSASLIPLPFIAWYIAFALSAVFALSAYRKSRFYLPDNPAREFTFTLFLIALFTLAGLRVAIGSSQNIMGVRSSRLVCPPQEAAADAMEGLNPLLRPICRLRNAFRSRILSLYDEPENALVTGIVIGDESRIPRALQSAFRITGTAHIVAISGANFTVLIWILMAFVRRVTVRWWSVLTLLPFVLGYTLLTGGTAPIVRAAILSALTLIGMALGESKEGETSLAFSAAIMGLVSPQVLFDAGFQLSVTATLGILLWNRPLADALERMISARAPEMDKSHVKSVVSLANELILTSFTAQILTTFVGASLFSSVSWVSLPCNAAIALLQTPLMFGGIISLALSYISFDLGVFAARCTTVFPTLTIRLVELFARIPGASRSFSLTKTQCWLICIGIVYVWKTREKWFERIVAFQSDWRSGVNRGSVSRFALITLFIATGMTWRSAAPKVTQFTNRAEIRAAERGGELTLTVRTPRGNVIRLSGNLETATLNGRAMFGEGNEDAHLDALTASNRNAVQEIQLGDMTFTQLFSYIAGDVLRIGHGQFALLIPNGASPKAFDSREIEWRDASLILIHSREAIAPWIRSLTEAGAKEPWRVLPGIINLKQSPSFTLRSDGMRYFYQPGHKDE